MDYKVANIVDLDTTKLFEFHKNLLGDKVGPWFVVDEDGYPINRFEHEIEAIEWLEQFIKDINDPSTMSLEDALAFAESLEE